MALANDWRLEPDPNERTLTLLEEPSQRARPLSPLRAFLGRTFDIVGSLVLLLLASPLIAAGAVVVLAGGGRPIFFGHERVGLGGRLFRCWKLRTMHPDAESRLAADQELHRRYLEHGFKLPLADDPRLIPGARWLRSRYLDELPQLWNVLVGDMALIGWRPVVPSEVALYGEHAATLLQRRPGLFGEWSSRGRARPPYPERVALEVELVLDPTLRRSFSILRRSMGAVLAGLGDEA